MAPNVTLRQVKGIDQILNRQKLVISLINRSGGRVTRLHLVKQAFLLKENLDPRFAASFYGFVPYHSGPSSFTLYHELGSMASAGLVRFPSLRAVEITDDGDKATRHLEPGLEQEIERFQETYGQYGTNELVDLVYSRYPWYTTRSRRRGYSAIQPKEADYAVYTIGYEGMQVDEFLDLLLRSGIRRIIDVRRNAVSRRFGFAGSTLSSLARKMCVKYCHEPGVGVPTEWRDHLETAQDLSRLLQKYAGELLTDAEESVKRIDRWVVSEPSALMCMEADPARCHRSVLAQSVHKATGLSVKDLRWFDERDLSDHARSSHRDDLPTPVGGS